MAIATLTDQQSSQAAAQQPSEAQTEAWKQQTVGDFFARCNWENVETPVLEALVTGQPVALDYSLTVGQFFGTIPWDGGAMLAAISAQATPGMAQPEPAQELPSLDDDSAPEELPELEEIADESHLDGGDVTLDDFLGSFAL